MVVKYHSFSILSVSISLLDYEADSLSRWIVHKLNLLALPIALGWLLAVLKIHARIDVHQLAWCAIKDSLSSLFLDPSLVVQVLLLDSFFKHSGLLLLQQDFTLHIILTSIFATIKLLAHRSLMDGFLFPPKLSHWIVSKLWDDGEHHAPKVGNMRAVDLGTLLHQDLWAVKADCSNIAVDRITIK